ncbi:MAG: hypothetical protein ACK2U9_08450, partial [Anaerolineae bacterium]
VLGMLVWASFVPGPAWSSGPAPEWVTLSGRSDTGRFELEWRGAGTESAGLYRLEERGPAGDYRYFIEGERHGFFRAAPGRYRFRVAACQRLAREAPSCTRWSEPLAIEVSSAFLDRVTRTAPTPSLTSQTALAQPVPGLRPGGWYDPQRSGHGWTFYRVNPMALGPGDPWFGAAYDLVGFWYTYEASQRFITSDPGEPVEVDYFDYRPVWLVTRLVTSGGDTLEGSLFRRRATTQDACTGATWVDGICEEQVGGVSLEYSPGASSARMTWNASFPLQATALAGQELVLILPGSAQPEIDHPGHHSGLWQPGAATSLAPGEALLIETIAPDFEAADLLFFDDAGQPVWMSHQPFAMRAQYERIQIVVLMRIHDRGPGGGAAIAETDIHRLPGPV